MSLSVPEPGYGITSGFGHRERPSPSASANHKGIDYGTPVGTPVLAAGPGIVSNLQDPGGYGNYVSIRHPDGSRTVYGHLSGFALPNGAQVTAGQRVGTSGRSGNATGPNMHFGYYLPDGTPVDPRQYLGGQQ